MGDGLYLIDTDYLRPGLAASHLLVDQGRAAFIDTGPGPAAPKLLAALDELGIAREQVDYLFLTHVHLDHAGGAGQMTKAINTEWQSHVKETGVTCYTCHRGQPTPRRISHEMDAWGNVPDENRAGIRLMERGDYTRCGCLRNVGEKFGRTLDVVIFQKEL